MVATRMGARELLDLVVDGGTWVGWDEPPVDPLHGDAAYAAELAAARSTTGVDEALITGQGCISGRPVAIVACEFAFLAGSIGVAAAERLVRAVERATAQQLPLVAAPTSGGAGRRGRAARPACAVRSPR